MKPGWQTTEFWLSLASQVIAVLVLTGVVPQQDQSTLAGIVANAITGAFAVIAAVTMGVTYIQNRTSIKKDQMAITQAAFFPPSPPQTTVNVDGGLTQGQKEFLDAKLGLPKTKS